MQANECEICGSRENCEVYHIRKLSGLEKRWRGRKEKPDRAKRMIAMQRKTLVVCVRCYDTIHNGKPLPNLSKETNKGKLEGSLQGYHNGTVPWGYVSERIDRCKVGMADREKASVVVAMFECYATGTYSDMQIAEWLNAQGFHTNRDQPFFGKDTVRDMLCLLMEIIILKEILPGLKHVTMDSTNSKCIGQSNDQAHLPL